MLIPKLTYPSVLNTKVSSFQGVGSHNPEMLVGLKMTLEMGV